MMYALTMNSRPIPPAELVIPKDEPIDHAATLPGRTRLHRSMIDVLVLGYVHDSYNVVRDGDLIPRGLGYVGASAF